MSYNLGILMFEAISVYLLVLWVHALRRRIGLAPFYALLGAMTALMSWITDAGWQVSAGGLSFMVGSTVFYTSILLGVFVVYVFDGPREARTAIATVAGISILAPLAEALFYFQAQGIGGTLAGTVLAPDLRLNAASVLTTIADLFFLALAWEFLGTFDRRLHLWIRTLLTLLGVMGLDVLLFTTGAFAGTPGYLGILSGSLISRLVISVFASLFLYAYLVRRSRRADEEIVNRPLLAILGEMEEVRGQLLQAEEEVEYHKQVEELLRENKTLAQATLDSIPAHIAIVDRDGKIVSVNRAWSDFGLANGLSEAESGPGADYLKVCRLAEGAARESAKKFQKGLLDVLSGKDDYFENSYACQTEDTCYFFTARISPLETEQGRWAIIVHTDETDKDMARRRQVLLNRIFRRLNSRGTREEMLSDTLVMIKEHTGVDAAAIRLKRKADYPFCVADGFSPAFIEQERCLCSCDANGKVCLSESGLPELECLCGWVIRQGMDGARPFVTEGGSFWTNCATELLRTCSENGLPENIRGGCVREGYESIALVPLRAGDEVVGILQLNDRRINRFSKDRILFFEELGVAIGVELQQVQFEEKLETREKNTRDMIRAARDGIWEWDIENDRLSCSPQWYEMLGYQADEFSIDSETFREMLHPDDRPQVEEAFRAYFCGEKERFDVEYRFRCKNGSYSRIWSRGTLVDRNECGDPSRMMGIHADVTGRYVADEKIKEGEARYHQLFDSMQAGFALHEIICDEDGKPVDYRFLEVNPAFEQLTGLKAEDLIGRRVREVLPETEQYWIDAYGEVALSGNPLKIEEFASAFGRYYFVAAYSPKRGQFATVFNDITEQKEAARALRESEERFRALFEESPVAYQSLSPSGCILEVNRTWLDLLGYEREEVVGRSFSEFMTEESVLNFPSYFARFKETGRAAGIEFELSRKDGRDFFISLDGRVARDADRQVVRTHCIFRDVTEEKSVREAIIQARDAAEASNEAKTQFLANMSHELRTPLNAIIGLSELLEDSTLDAEQADYVKTINASGEALLAIVSDLLDLSKIEMGKLNVALGTCRVRTVVDQAVSMVEGIAGEKGLHLSVHIDKSVPEQIHNDEDRLQQILLNLLDNALKFTDEGFVRLAVRPVVLPSGSCQVEFLVQDSGIGMDEKTLRRVFEPFHQADASNTRKHGGVGLGLTICKDLAERMGGGIFAESTKGSGACFRLRVMDFSQKKKPVDLEKIRSAWQGRQICIWDNDPGDLHTIEHVLVRCGITPVYVAESCDLARHLSGEDEPAAVLCNLDMEEFSDHCHSGSLPETEIPWIGLCAWDSQVPASVKERFAAFLDRPLQPELLYQTFAQLK